MMSPATREDLCQVLEWDSKFFGFKVGRVKPSRLASAAMPRVLEWCDLHRIDCLYLLADADDTETSRLAAEHGFCLVDVRITLERSLSPDSAPSGQCPAELRPFQPGDLPGLRRLAAALHTDTRFFFDRHFPPARSRELYGVWIERSCLDPRGRVFVVAFEGEPAGYIACSTAAGQTGQIQLVGVESRAQGRGFGQGLVTAALNWFAAEGIRRVSVVTQGRNVRAQRLYQKAGFVTGTVQLWYHLWFNRPANPSVEMRP